MVNPQHMLGCRVDPFMEENASLVVDHVCHLKPPRTQRYARLHGA